MPFWQQRILEALSPYRAGFPAHEGIMPGTVVSARNWQLAEEFLPSELLACVRAGDFAITVVPTQDFPLHEHYRAATLRHAADVRLDAHGHLESYTAGLPFPVLDLTDPQAGLKLAWNLRLRSLGGDSEELRVLWTTLHGATVERSLEMRMWRLRLAHRTVLEPVELRSNPLGLYHVTVSTMLSPAALHGWQSITYRYDDDRQADDTWVYAPRQVTALNSDYHGEDGYGYNGSVHSQSWRYLGETVVLAPVGIPRGAPSFGGRNGWYPVDPYQLRRAHVLEAMSRDPGHHYARRVFYVDAQLWMPFYTLGYNRQGEFFKLVFHMFGDPAHSPWNRRHQGPINLGACAINYARDHATLLPNIEQRFNHDVTAHPFMQAALDGKEPGEALYEERAGFAWIAIGRTARLAEILPGRLYQSGLPDEREIKEKDISVVVNLAGRHQTAPVPDALSIIWPVADGELPDIAILQGLSAWLVELLQTTDKKVLVHCVASVNRSSLLIGCILHRFLGLSGEALIRYLEEKSGGYAILTNQKFREYLESLQEMRSDLD
jgi:hypothetical protein